MQTKEKTVMRTTRGVRKLPDRPGRPNPYGVQWRQEGKAKTEFYSTKTVRDDRYDELVGLRKAGFAGISASRDDLKDWFAFRQVIGNANWRDVVAAWKTSPSSITESPTIEVAAEEYLALKDPDGSNKGKRVAADTFRHKRQKVRLLVRCFPGRMLHQFKGAEIVKMIDGMGSESPTTFNSYRGTLHAFFSHYAKVCPHNPVDDFDKREVTKDEITRLSVEQTQTLFDYALKHSPALLGRLACEAFAGIRFGSAYKLAKEDIKLAERGILFPAAKLKTRRRHYVDGFPPNLWAWLALSHEDCWQMTPAEYMHKKSKLFRDAKVAHPHNVLRHSFATYHVNGFKDPGKTAFLLCHQSQKKLWDAYRGNATEAEGKAYFEIMPRPAAAGTLPS